MIRSFHPVIRILRPTLSTFTGSTKIIGCQINHFSTLQKPIQTLPSPLSLTTSLLNNKKMLEISSNISAVPVRSVTKFSRNKGKRATVKAAIKRFYRLEWGGWIRPKVGRTKHLWKKSPPQKRRLRQHIFCNGTQTTLLDKMVTKFWKKPKYWVDDPYEPYHTREEFAITRKKPLVRS